jgi:predicted nucleotidyltransferase
VGIGVSGYQEINGINSLSRLFFRGWLNIIKNMKISTASGRKKSLQKELDRVLKVIKNQYQPEKVFLFGSLVNGKVHEWSDIDLMIIKKTERRPVERCLELSRLIQPRVGIDLFIYTPEEFKVLKREKFSHLLTILETGKVLYEKGNSRMV